MMAAQILHGRTFILGGFRCGLAIVGPKWAQVVIIDDGNRLRVQRQPARQVQFSPLAKYPTPESLARAFLRRRRVRDMTKGARKICNGILK